jgi:hypothetical protein
MLNLDNMNTYKTRHLLGLEDFLCLS